MDKSNDFSHRLRRRTEMSLQVEKMEKNMAKLTIEVSAEELEKALQGAYNKQKGQISVRNIFLLLRKYDSQRYAVGQWKHFGIAHIFR